MTDPTEDKLWAEVYAAAFALWCDAPEPNEDRATKEALRTAGAAVEAYRANKVARAESDPFAVCVCGHTRALHDKYPEYSGSCPECHENFISGRARNGCRGFRSAAQALSRSPHT